MTDIEVKLDTEPKIENEITKPFNTEEVTNIIKETVEAVLTDTVYQHANAPAWNNDIVEGTLKKLDKTKGLKYIVTCVIVQKKGGGFYAGSSVFWDNSTDGSVSYRHDTKTMYTMVTVFGLAI
ncbi:dynein light chain [Endogone sp. FLAS-F59071]|nr:dynein light chain [Endogone sp. FLAS-F59071]|eukprot:RUS20542.1 dynein light chain [Endogone sp. FLAS-F59071]